MGSPSTSASASMSELLCLLLLVRVCWWSRSLMRALTSQSEKPPSLNWPRSQRLLAVARARSPSCSSAAKAKMDRTERTATGIAARKNASSFPARPALKVSIGRQNLRSRGGFSASLIYGPHAPPCSGASDPRHYGVSIHRVGSRGKNDLRRQSKQKESIWLSAATPARPLAVGARA